MHIHICTYLDTFICSAAWNTFFSFTGFLVDFISGPVSAGFTSAAAIVIAMTQVKDLLGLNFSATKFTEVWVELSKNYQNISIGDAVLGFSCIIILFVLRVSMTLVSTHRRIYCGTGGLGVGRYNFNERHVWQSIYQGGDLKNEISRRK